LALPVRPRPPPTSYKAFTPDFSRAEDGDVLEVLAPNQTVVPVAVSEVLILIPGMWFGRVVLNARTRFRRYDSCSLVQVQRDVTLKMDWYRQIGSGGEETSSTSVTCGTV